MWPKGGGGANYQPHSPWEMGTKVYFAPLVGANIVRELILEQLDFRQAEVAQELLPGLH